mgnify:CR=1 FL=1
MGWWGGVCVCVCGGGRGAGVGGGVGGGFHSARTFFSARLLIFSNSNDTFKGLDFSYFVINWLLKKN